VRFVRVILPVAALALSGLSAFALAQDGGPTGPTGTNAAAVEAVCGGPPPCTAVNTLADPDAAGKEGQVAQFEEAFATRGRPASDCPEAAAGYEAAGLHVDVFLGPCPDPEAARRYRPSPLIPGDEMVSKGGH
jgi:hypothetical protein